MGAHNNGLAIILANLNAAREEFARSEDVYQQRVTERAQEHRANWHKADMAGQDGIFFEAITETVAANQAELYALMLADPAQFGIRLAQLASSYADSMAVTLSA